MDSNRSIVLLVASRSWTVRFAQKCGRWRRRVGGCRSRGTQAATAPRSSRRRRARRCSSWRRNRVFEEPELRTLLPARGSRCGILGLTADPGSRQPRRSVHSGKMASPEHLPPEVPVAAPSCCIRGEQTQPSRERSRESPDITVTGLAHGKNLQLTGGEKYKMAGRRVRFDMPSDRARRVCRHVRSLNKPRRGLPKPLRSTTTASKTRVQPILLNKKPGNARCPVCHRGTGAGIGYLQVLSPGAATWDEEQSQKTSTQSDGSRYHRSPTRSRLLHAPACRGSRRRRVPRWRATLDVTGRSGMADPRRLGKRARKLEPMIRRLLREVLTS